MYFIKFKTINLFLLTLVVLLSPMLQVSAQIIIKNDANISSPSLDSNLDNNQASATNDKYVNVNGSLFGDANNDGIKNNGEVGLPNISLKITQVNGEVIDVITDSDGNYSFLSLTGLTQVTIDSNDLDLPVQAILTTGSLSQTIDLTNSIILNSVGFSIPSVNLNLIKTVNKTNAKIQESLIYSLKFSNKGARTANDVKVIDQLPDSLEFISATYQNQDITPNIENNSTGQKLTFVITTLEPNQPKEILVTVKIKETTNTKITNQANILSREADPDINDNQSKINVDITRTIVGNILNTIRTGGYDSNPSEESLLIKNSSLFMLALFCCIPLAFFVIKKTLEKNN